MGFIVVDGCNPNGDPSNGNLPRITYDGHGEISSVSIKRKIRDTLYFMGCDIFVCSELSSDGCSTQKERADKIEARSPGEFRDLACKKWIDTRLFGQVLPIPKKLRKDAYADTISIGIRGPVTISQAVSIDPVVSELQWITRAEGLLPPEGGKLKSPTTFGRKNLIRKSAYVFTGGVSPQLASLTGASDDDIIDFRDALLKMYEYTPSSSRPDGTIFLHRLLWWEMEGNSSPAKIIQSVRIEPSEQWPYYKVAVEKINNAKMEEFV